MPETFTFQPAIRWALPAAGAGVDWGTAGPYGFSGNTRGDNEIERVGEGGAVIDGRRYLRIGTASLPDYLRPYAGGAGDFVRSREWGGLLSEDAANRFDSDRGDKSSFIAVALASLGLGAIVAPAIIAGAAAVEGGTAAGFGIAEAGASGALEIGAGEGVLSGFTAEAGALGSGFSLPSLPSGVSSAVNAARSALGGASDSLAGAIDALGGAPGGASWLWIGAAIVGGVILLKVIL